MIVCYEQQQQQKPHGFGNSDLSCFGSQMGIYCDWQADCKGDLGEMSGYLLC